MRSVIWPSVGTSDVVDQDEPPAGPDDVVVDVSVSVLSAGTERARLLGLPTAAVQFPHTPGYMAAGFVRSAREMPAGTPVAVRGSGHQSVAVAPARLVEVVADHVPLADAAVWQLALTALHGLARGEHQPGEPAAVVGAGLLGIITRRLLAAFGTPTVTAVASSDAKSWAARTEPATAFLSADRVGADSPLVLDVTGSPDGLATAIAATADTGRIVLLGSPRASLADVPLQQVYDRQLRIVGAHVANLDDGDEPALSQTYFDLLTSNRFTVCDVLAEYPAHEAPVVYQRLVTDRSFVGATLRWAPDQPRSGRDRTPRTASANQAARRASATGNATPAARGRSAETAAAVRFGLIGCGDIGIKDAEAVIAAGAELVACYDPLGDLARDVATRFHTGTEPDLAILLARHDVDAVIIATPHDTHEPLALAALEAGKHVLLEKPLAHDLASARRIAAAAAASAPRTGVLFPMRSDPRFGHARAAIDQGLVGAPRGAAASYLVDKPKSYFYGGFSQRARSSWRLSKARSGGGFLIMNLVHQIDAIRALLGVDAEYVYADTAPSPVAPEIEDVVTVVARFGTAIVTVTGGASVPGGCGQHLRLWGDAGQVQVLPEYALTSRRRQPRPIQVAAGDPRVLAIARFAASVRDQTPVDVPADEALAVQAIVEAAYESARLGRRVRPAVAVNGAQQ